MLRRSIFKIITALALLGFVAVIGQQPAVRAQAVAGYQLLRSSINSGGGSNADSGYSLQGSLAQPAPGVLIEGGFMLQGGFWFSTNEKSGSQKVFIPVITRGN